MPVTTSLSGNEIFCLAQKGYTPGNIVVGNSVYSLGLLGGFTSGLKAIIGGEVTQITRLIEEGRQTAYERMLQEARAHHASGITGVTSELIFHGGNVEFLSIGSVIHGSASTTTPFSTSADGQELFAQLDAGYRPICFAFGNAAYSLGIGRGIVGGLKTMGRGEIKEYSDIFNHTRHLALQRIIAHAKQHNANAVLGIQTSILPVNGLSEMLMIGTASQNLNLKSLPSSLAEQVVTSDMTNIEMWNMATAGYAPMRLLLGTSVYSLGLAGGISSALKSFVRGEINELTRLIYDARENALGIINDEAKSIGADDVIGVKTYVYQLGNGLIEFLAIGTAVKKISGLTTESAQLPPQAIVVDRDTFYESVVQNVSQISVNKGLKSGNSGAGWLAIIAVLIIYLVIMFFNTFIH